MRAREAGIRTALAAGSVLLALGLGEAYLRLASPGYSPLFLDIFRLEDGLLQLRPNVSRRHVSSEWNVLVETDADGLRERARPLVKRPTRVLLVGDSFAFGWGVELEQSFGFVAEELAGPQGPRIVKAGIPATGTRDQLDWLRRFGSGHSPDALVLAFFVGNDFVDVGLGRTAERFAVEEGLLVRREPGGEGSGSSGWRGWLKRRSLLAQRAAFGYWALERRFLPPWLKPNPGLRDRDRMLESYSQVHLRRPPPEILEAEEDTLQALSGIQDWCRAHGARFLLMVIPRSIQVYDWELEAWRLAFDLEPEDLDLDRPQRVLEDWSRIHDAEMLDLLPAFRRHRREHPDSRLYFYPNGHWNRAGHRLAAAELAAWLRRTGPRAAVAPAPSAPGSPAP